MPPQIFKNKVIAAAGPLPGQLTAENLKRWTENRRGRFSIDLDPTVTHLLCTRAQYRAKLPIIKEALQKREGRKRVYILDSEWFEFSTAHNERLPESDYLMTTRKADRRARLREKHRWERGLLNGLKFVNTNLYHIYRDRDFFPYELELRQFDPDTGDLEWKYILCLWESNAKPHLHWFTAKLLDKRPGRPKMPMYHRGSEHSVRWRIAFDQLQVFFKKQCAIAWEDRVTEQRTKPWAFQYDPPTGGKPVGSRLRYDLATCLEKNANLRGLPWPPEPERVEQLEDGESEYIVEADDNAEDMLAENIIQEDSVGSKSDEQKQDLVPHACVQDEIVTDDIPQLEVLVASVTA